MLFSGIFLGGYSSISGVSQSYLQEGDELLSFDGQNAAGLDLTQVVAAAARSGREDHLLFFEFGIVTSHVGR